MGWDLFTSVGSWVTLSTSFYQWHRLPCSSALWLRPLPCSRTCNKISQKAKAVASLSKRYWAPSTKFICKVPQRKQLWKVEVVSWWIFLEQEEGTIGWAAEWRAGLYLDFQARSHLWCLVAEPGFYSFQGLGNRCHKESGRKKLQMPPGSW